MPQFDDSPEHDKDKCIGKDKDKDKYKVKDKDKDKGEDKGKDKLWTKLNNDYCIVTHQNV